MDVLDRDVMRRALNLKTLLTSTKRHFIFDEDIQLKSMKEYKYQPMDIRLLRFANDSYGTLSDCFILYAVAKLGVCDRETIQLFLKALKKTEPRLVISDPDLKEGLMNRLHVLFSNGFLFKNTYFVESRTSHDNASEDTIQLYTIDRDSQSFMNQKLGKRVVINQWIQAKPLNELIGWASATYVGTSLANNGAFKEYKDAIFRCKSLGVVNIPCEIKMETNDNYYVGIFFSYLFHNVKTHTDSEYQDDCIYKINTILNYITFRENAKKTTRVVISVENLEDMNNMAQLIIDTEVLIPHLDKIYFTGEGVLKNITVEDSLLQLFISENTKNGYEFLAATPDFMKL